MYSKWMLLIYAYYRPMRLTVHTIIYWFMLHMLSIGNTLQQWYQAMMHHCLNIDVLCMFISNKYYIHCQSIAHFTLRSLLDILCHCDLLYLLNSFVSVTVCYRSMPVITYVINQCPTVMHLPSPARLNDQDGRHAPPTICWKSVAVFNFYWKVSLLSTMVGKVSSTWITS